MGNIKNGVSKLLGNHIMLLLIQTFDSNIHGYSVSRNVCLAICIIKKKIFIVISKVNFNEKINKKVYLPFDSNNAISVTNSSHVNH